MKFIKVVTNQKEFDDLEVGEEFWDDDLGLKKVKFSENRSAIVLDENFNTVPKPEIH